MHTQVDPSNLPTPVSSEEYIPPEDVPFEQVWAPLPATENGRRDQYLDLLVKDFAGVVSHDKVQRRWAALDPDAIFSRATILPT